MGHLSLTELCEGKPGGGAPLLVTPRDMLNKGLEMDICFHRVPSLGNMVGHSFPRAFVRRDKFLYLGEFL